MGITIDKVGGITESKHAEIFGSSTDIKPMDVNLNDILLN